MSKKKRDWKIINEGAFANIKTFSNLNSKVRVRAMLLIEAGEKVFIASNVSSKIELGRICVKLKYLVGDRGFAELVENFWCQKNQKYSDIERELQYCQKMYKFSRRVGPRLDLTMPIDSFRKVMAHVLSINTFKEQNRCIRRINETGKFQDVDIANTKKLRAALSQAKIKARGKESNQNAQPIKATPGIKELLKCHKDIIKIISDLIEEIPGSDREVFVDLYGKVQPMLSELVDLFEERDWQTEYVDQAS